MKKTNPHISIDDLLAAYVVPNWLPLSAWLEHIPFAMYITLKAKPRIFVELGTHYGASYCAFCEAALSAGLDGHFFAVDTWKGDEHSEFYDESVYATLAPYHDQRYGEFSTLIRKTFEESVAYFSDGSIDLLHLDGYHSYEETRKNFEQWLPKMSDRGIMLFHDTNVRRDDFGVWKVWQELSSEYPHFEFHHGHGLGVLRVGSTTPPDLEPFFTASEAEQAALRKFFAYAGKRWSTDYERRIAQAGLEQQQRLAAERDQQFQQQLQAMESKTSGQLAQLTGQYEAERKALVSEYEAQLAASRDQLQQQLREFEAKAHEEQASLTQRYEAERNALVTHYETTLTNTRDQSGQQLSSLETRMNEAIKQLTGQHEAERTALVNDYEAQFKAAREDAQQRVDMLQSLLNEELERIAQEHQAERDSERAALVEQYEARFKDLCDQTMDHVGRLETAVKQEFADLTQQYEAEQQAALDALKHHHEAQLAELTEQFERAEQNYEMQLAELLNQHELNREAYENQLTELNRQHEMTRDAYDTHIAELNHQHEDSRRVYETRIAELNNLHELTRSTVESERSQHEIARNSYTAQIDDLNRQIEHAFAEITRMRGTKGWTLLERWWRFKRWLMPNDSNRVRIYYLLRTSFEILVSEGPLAFFRRLDKWLQGERRYHMPAYKPLETASTQFRLYPADTSDYDAHIRRVEPGTDALRRQIQEARAWVEKPLMSIVTPVYNTPLAILEETVQSVRTQTYEHWQWDIVDASSDEAAWKYLSEIAALDGRIRPHRLQKNKGIAANTNVALHKARGDYIVLLDHDDVITPNALFEVVSVIRNSPGVDLIYSDEDKLDEQGRRCDVLYKPDWSPDMLLSVNIITHLCVFRRNLLQKVGYLDPAMDGAQDWDFFLRVSEYTRNIHHIPQILYHWRKSSQSTAQLPQNKSVQETQAAAVRQHLIRSGLLDPEVYFDTRHPPHCAYPVARWKQRRPRKISIIIPSRDQAAILGKCLTTLFSITNYPDYEVVIVDTGSQEPPTYALYEQYAQEPRFRVIYFREPFNFSRACNTGAGYASGELLLFMNNDCEILHEDWLDFMAQWFEREGVGIVGAKLLYPTGMIQHAGVGLGLGGLASHPFVHLPEFVGTMFGTEMFTRNLLAVTGACLMISREAYNRVNGFDEHYKLNYSDVELCLNVYEAGYRIVYTPHARLIHHESVTHGRKIPRSDFERASNNWRHWLIKGDPYLNPNLSCLDSNPRFVVHDRDAPYLANLDLMRRLPAKDLIQLPDDLIPSA